MERIEACTLAAKLPTPAPCCPPPAFNSSPLAPHPPTHPPNTRKHTRAQRTRGELIQQLHDVLEVADLAAGRDQHVVVHALDALDGLVALGGAVRAQRVARDHHAASVLEREHRRARDHGVLRVLARGAAAQRGRVHHEGVAAVQRLLRGVRGRAV
jgi:hypothetical protein